jgi:PD-(D/E)XK nuclease superfamily
MLPASVSTDTACARHQNRIVQVVDGEAQGGAMQQLKDKCYVEKYRAEGLPIHLIGVEFSKKTRNVVGFEVELLG